MSRTELEAVERDDELVAVEAAPIVRDEPYAVNNLPPDAPLRTAQWRQIRAWGLWCAVAAVLFGILGFSTMYRSSGVEFVEPQFAVSLALLAVAVGWCAWPHPQPNTDLPILPLFWFIFAALAVYALSFFAGEYAGYFAQFYNLLTFIALYRFSRRMALLMCFVATLGYLMLAISVPTNFPMHILWLSMSWLWASVGAYLLLYTRQQHTQRQLLTQLEAEHRLRRQLEITNSIATSISGNPNLDELLNEVVGAAARLIDAPFCSLQLCDYPHNLLLMRTIYSDPQFISEEAMVTIQHRSFGINQGLSGWVVKTSECISVDRAADDPRFTPVSGLQELGEWALLLVPLIIKQRVMGVLGLAHPHSHHFTDDDRAALTSFATQAAVAIENATLISEIMQQKGQLERSQAGLAAVLDINRTILTQRDYMAALRAMVDNLMPLIPFANCVVYHVEEGGSNLVTMLAEGVGVSNMEYERFPVGEGIIGAIAANGVAELVNHAELDPRSVIIPGTELEEAESLLAAPLFVEGQVRGVIRLGRTHEWLFEEDELELLKVFATQASLALENAHLIESQSRTANDQSWMMSLTEILISALNIEEQMQQVVRASVSLTEADLGALLLEENGRLKVAATSVPQDYLQVGQYYSEDGSPITEAFRTATAATLLGSLIGDPPPANSQPAIASRFRAQLAVPLIVGNHMLGVLSVFSAEATSFDRRYLRLLSTFANQAAIALRNSQLFNEAESRSRKLEEQARQLEVSERRAKRSAVEQAMLFQISKMAVNTRSLVDKNQDQGEWLRQSLNLVTVAMGVEKASITLLDDKHQRELIAEYGFSPAGVDIMRRTVDNCELHQWVEQYRRAQPNEDCATSSGMLGWLATHEGIHNALAVPLLARDEMVIGVLTVYNKRDAEQGDNIRQNSGFSLESADEIVSLPFGGNGHLTTISGTSLLGTANGSNGSNGSSGYKPTARVSKGLPAHQYTTFNKDNITLMWNMANAIASGLENARSYRSLRDTYFDTIRMLVDIMEAKDPYTKGHSEKVMVCARAIGEELIRSGHPEFKAEDMEKLQWAALLHDIGKLGIRDELLHLAERPGVEGFWVLSSHTRRGARILNNIAILKPLANLVQAHHERWDGQGYPDGLLRQEIHIISRIVTVADSFDAMTSDRDYQKKRTIEWAMEELERNRGTQFDPDVADAFLRILHEQGDPREREMPHIGPLPAPDFAAA